LRKLIFLFVVLAFFVSCSEEEIIVNIPDYESSNFIPSSALPLTEAAKKKIEGIFEVVEGQDYFGDTAVVKWTGKGLPAMSAFYQSGGKYFYLEAGSLDNVIFFEGYWRNPQNEETGKLFFRIDEADGGDKILDESYTGDINVVIYGKYQNSSNESKDIRLKFSRKLKSNPKPFYILAHRGGGRSSDLIPHSENSVELVNICERFGTTGIEIDVKITTDGEAVLYHDSNLNSRLIQKNGLVGNLEEYSFKELRTFVKLIHGENLPKLSEVLSTVIHNTDLKFVWLDMKSDKKSMEIVRSIQKNYLDSAQSLGRDLKIVIGLPTEDKIDELRATFPNDYKNVPTLCELMVEDAIELNSVVWGPRWTLGYQEDKLQQVHQNGKLAFVWTMDVQGYIKQFIEESEFDGILTNYPSIVAYYHYINEK
jgi:glycerophosphoryl diester phosphodiesterase